MNAEEKRLLWMIALGVVRRVPDYRTTAMHTTIGDENVSGVASELYQLGYIDLPTFDPKAKTRQWFLTNKGKREL